MDSQDNKLKGQIQSLRSSNKNSILDTLKELRTVGNVSVLPELFQVMMVQEDEQILGEIAGLLNDLKDQEAADILAAAISNPEYKTIRHTLLAACWQNGLSYGKYLGVFAEVLISADYVTAIEAFTVLEEAIGDVDAPVREKLASRLKSRLNEMEEIKKPLLSELIKTINSY